MKLAVGDSVVYPKHGVGQITAIEHQELVAGFEDYYVIEMPHKRLTLRIPMGKMDELGVRPVMRPTKLAGVLDTLRSVPTPLPSDNKKRQGQLRQKLGRGYPLQIAEAIRDLTWHKELEHLTKADSELLAWGQELLTAELAVVTNTEMTEARNTINAALFAAIEGQTAVAAR